MVYRLYRASRFRMARIFTVLLIYSLIIGSIGFVLLGIVVNFDAQSFNPSIYDANVQRSSSDPKAGLICENYKSDNCNWYLFNDLQGRTYYEKNKPELDTIQERVDLENLLMLKEQQTNSSVLVSGAISIYANNTFLSYNITNYINFTTGPQYCFMFLKGITCPASNLDQINTQVNTEDYRIIPNLNLFGNKFGSYIGSNVLVNDQNQILCNNWPQNCTYIRNAEPGNYTYYGASTSGIQKGSFVTAKQVIIRPNSLVSDTGRLVDADNSGQVNIICQNEYPNSFNFCNLGNTTYLDPNSFIFANSSNYLQIGQINLVGLTNPSSSDVFNFNNHFSSFYCQKAKDIGLINIMDRVPLTCLPTTSGENSVSYSNEPFPLNGRENINAPKLVFSLEEQNILVKVANLESTTQGKSTPAILINIISRPGVLLRNITTNDITSQVLLVAIISFIINILLALILIFIRFWKRIGGWLGPKSTLMLRGKVGGLLELTQFFQFGGSWYLEAQSVNDYNFNSTMGVVHELVRERWRDTIFFPTSLAASISIVIFTVYSDPVSILSLFILGGLLPLLLAFWIPALWVIQDSGLKRAEWDNNGELLTIQKISDILRDGFNKLVGFSAIFGLGTAGATVIRAQITGSSVNTASALTGGFQNLINLNFNFLASAILWTAALLFIVTAVSLPGNVITSLSYLNTDHLSNVKKMRTKLQGKEIFLGTTQPSMDHANRDTSVYFDSKQGIDSVLAQQTSKRGKALPENTVITKQAFKDEEDLTQIIIADPKDFENEPEKSDQTTSSESSTEESSSPDADESSQNTSTEEESDTEGESTEQQSTEDSDTNGGTSSDESTWFAEDTSTSDSSDSEYKKDE